ncbi:threonine--tRNA ligase [Candidatus Dojkabacteria bacterium]|uniref:Threonine--tRNA ligase n=1 Tax=Candidatus Dojkabacteria bacterium TaxID=2099670 RepID=A0A3M0YXU1_9BACT|nr:MAG: threonine--tRNA ligase [Candidatus Dojkabacteria bacterium]
MQAYSYTLNHSAEHVFSQAVKELYGDLVKPAVAHITETGFASDAKWSFNLSEEKLPEIEAKMAEIVSKALPIVKKEISCEDAEKLFKDNPYKLEWIKQFNEQQKTLTVYWTGDQYVDLCKGPHVSNTSEIKAFKLLSLSGVYWRGDSSNEQLTRVYGVAFSSQSELDKYLQLLEESKRRDHRKLGKELNLFVFSELVGSGLPLFTPKGAFLRSRLSEFSEELQRKAGFEQVWIPHLTKVDLYKVSGHWDKFGSELFLVSSQETSDQLVLKPMNCPHHAQIYASQIRSYKDLPIRYYETTTVYRDEKAGELSGLSRVRSITQDDAHIFCRMDQIESEFRNIMTMIKTLYNCLGLSFSARLSFRDQKRPEKYHGDDEIWCNAQGIIERVAQSLGLDYFISEGEAAFYGPKIDIMITDSLGRKWQCATQQLDFVQPKRFGLKYIDSDGTEKTPVMIHKALLGSIERFLSVYIEHTAGVLPSWLCYHQVAVIPISEEKHIEYANEVNVKLKENGIRTVLFDQAETVSNKIRKAQTEKYPYMIVLGDKEKESGTISLRLRTGEQIAGLSISQFIQKVKEIEQSKSHKIW